MIEPDHTEPVDQAFPPARADAAFGWARWGMGDAVASYAIFVLFSTALGLLAFRGDSSNRLVGMWLPVVVVLPPLAQAAHLKWMMGNKGRGFAADLGLSFQRGDPMMAVRLWLLALATAAVAGAFTVRVLGDSPNAAVAVLAENSDEGTGVTIWIVLLVVAAITVIPFVEELLYRGLWWSALEKRGASRGLTLVLTSFIFAVAHLEPSRTPILFALGLAIGWGRMRTGRIVPGILAHAMINAVGMTALLAAL